MVYSIRTHFLYLEMNVSLETEQAENQLLRDQIKEERVCMKLELLKHARLSPSFEHELEAKVTARISCYVFTPNQEH